MTDVPLVDPAASRTPLPGEMPDSAPTPPVFTPAQISEDGHNRVARTSAQAGAALFATIVLRYLVVRYIGTKHLPPDEVVDAAQALATIGWARWANRERIRGEV